MELLMISQTGDRSDKCFVSVGGLIYFLLFHFHHSALGICLISLASPIGVVLLFIIWCKLLHNENYEKTEASQQYLYSHFQLMAPPYISARAATLNPYPANVENKVSS
jgi:hypothetical protein